MIKHLNARIKAGFQQILKRRLLSFAVLGKKKTVPLAARQSNVRWLKRRWLEWLGKPGVIGIGLLAVGITFYFSAIIQVQDRLTAARQEVFSLHEKIRVATKGGEGVQPPEEQLARFYKMFPSNKSLPLWLGKMFALAQSQGISLDEGEYKVVPIKAGNLIGFQMMLPIKAEYPKVRQYLADVMREIPIVSLQNVQFERQKVGDPNVEAKVKLVLYVEQQS